MLTRHTPSVETGLDKPEVVKESYVVDYTCATLDTLVKEEVGGNTDRWLYGLQSLQVKITSEGTDWWGQQTQQDVLTAYTHHDRLGSIVNLTDQYGRNLVRADYREYGEIAFYDSITVNGGYRRIAPQLVYTNHEWDDVLKLYYAKARFYDPDEKRFLSTDPVKGTVIDPLSLVPYLYCVDNPLRWVDPLGRFKISSNDYTQSGLSEDTYTELVSNAQRWLEAMNYLDMKGSSYGKYGGYSIGAVAFFQFNYGQRITSRLDTNTYLKIYNAYLNNLLRLPKKQAEKKYNEELERVRAIDKEYGELHADDYYRKYQCEFYQDPKPGFATMKDIPIVVYNGKYYMDYTNVIDATLAEYEPSFKIKTVDEYYAQYTWLGIAYAADYGQYSQTQLVWFAGQVQEEGPWDIKLKSSWTGIFGNDLHYFAQRFPFMYRGEIIDAEDLGNITYGYFGTSMGYPQEMLVQAGDAVSILTSHQHDSPDDVKGIKKGIQYYHDDH